MDRRKRLILFAVILFAVMLGVGIGAVQSSGYRDVCILSSIKRPDTLVVAGSLATLPTRNIAVIVYSGGGEKALYLATPLSSYSFAVVKQAEGGVRELVGDNEYAVFVLRGSSCNSTAIAFYSAREFTLAYGKNPVWEQEVVVEAKYYPGLRAVIYDASSHRVLYEGPVLVVQKILKGCHESYKETPATVG
jgi:hypothetical protein